MCNFKSGIILKNRVVLAPEENESHSDLLDNLNIEDDRMNAATVFIRAELTPPNGNKMANINEWKYRVDQDIVPEWYEKDPGRYEQEFRDAVEDYMKEYIKKRNTVNICGYGWTAIKDGDFTYYIMDGILDKKRFGNTNNYSKSDIRNDLINSKLAKNLKEKYGDNLSSISLDLTSMDGFKDYGSVEGDILAIPNVQFLMKFGDKIPLINNWYWLATPNQTPTRNDACYVQCVCSDGGVDCRDCCYVKGVRPFFILKSDIFVSCEEPVE